VKSLLIFLIAAWDSSDAYSSIVILHSSVDQAMKKA